LKIEKLIEDGHLAKLIVEVEPEKMDIYKRRAARKISERGKIAGFRPGKAPYDMVVRSYGEQAIVEQAIDYFIDAEYSNILKEAEVEPGASGALESIDSLEPPKMTFRVPLAPQVDLGDYRSLRMPYEWTAPDEKAVDAGIDELRRMYATTENVEREVQMGDYVLVDVKSEITELNRTGFAAFVREDERDTEWPYSGFARELIGLKAGDTKTIQHKFPQDHDPALHTEETQGGERDELEALQDKDAEMEVTVKTVRAVTLPELDDEFAKTVGAGETLESLREAVTKDVENRSKAEYDDKFFVELIEKLKEGATLKYNEHTLEHESEHVLEDLSQRISGQNMDLDTYFKLRNTTREQFIEDEVKPVAKKRLERSLILDEIVRREKIEVDNDSLDSEFNQTLNNLSMQGLDFGKIRGGKKGQQRVAQAVAMESANRLLTRRALDVLKTIATGHYKSAEDAEADMVSEGAPVYTPEEAVEEAVKAKADMVSEGAPVKSPEEALEEAVEAEAAMKSETEADS
jgi:trigger factor